MQITPPYTPYLSDYTTAGEQKLTLQLRPNDITLGDHPVRLRLTIEGVGITIRTRANYIPPTPHTLMGGGAPTLLYGDDLIEYFNPDNLDFAGFSKSDFQQSGKLPEGVYRFSFEVLDYYRQVSLSSKIMTVAWIVLNDPPLLNLPLNNTKVTIIDPTNIAFTWTPRHTSSPNSAFTTEYVFKMVEVWPVSRNAYDAFLSQPALYETPLTESQLLYGPSEPALLPGHKYAWQVQARDDADRDVFKNQGKSEVFVFQFGDLLGIPENLHKEGVNDQALTLAWEPAVRGETPALYHIRYKAASAESWSEILSDKQWVTLTGLKPNTDYEVQVRGKLDDVYSDYTPLLRAKTAEKAANFVCGQPPATIITDKTSRLLQLTPGDVFTCNDWRIVVREVTRSTDGEFAGKGLMAVKMFAGASIEVVFHGAINAGYQLITGGVESTYKKGSEMGSVVEEMKKIGEKKKDTTKTNIDSLPLPQLQELAQALINIPQEKIDKAIVLNQKEKQQINGARTKAKEALKTLNDPKATDKEKKEAEKNLRKAVADAKPAMDKLTNPSDKDLIAKLFKTNVIKEVLTDFENEISKNLSNKTEPTTTPKRGPMASDEFEQEVPKCFLSNVDLQKVKTYIKELLSNESRLQYFVHALLRDNPKGDTLLDETEKIVSAVMKTDKNKKLFKELVEKDRWDKIRDLVCEYIKQTYEVLSVIREKAPKHLASVSSENGVKGLFYVSPAGLPIYLTINAVPKFETSTSVPVAEGVLTGFTLGGDFWKGTYLKDKEKWIFTGYENEKTGEWWRMAHFEKFLEQAVRDAGTSDNTNTASVVLPIAIGFRGREVALGYLEKNLSGRALGWAKVGARFGLMTIFLSLLLSDTPHTSDWYYGSGVVVSRLTYSASQYAPPATLSITVPHAIPARKASDNGDCSVYVIWQLNTDGRSAISKFGKTCVVAKGGEQCNDRPESQCQRFNANKEEGEQAFFWNWIKQNVSNLTANILEKSLTAVYAIQSGGVLPTKHRLPCFVRDKDWDEDLEGKSAETERTVRAQRWLRDKLKEFGK